MLSCLFNLPKQKPTQAEVEEKSFTDGFSDTMTLYYVDTSRSMSAIEDLLYSNVHEDKFYEKGVRTAVDIIRESASAISKVEKIRQIV
jgi:hypothetical protein